MAIYRQLHTTFWKDRRVGEWSQDQKLFFLYLLSNDYTTQCGVYEFNNRYAKFELDMTDKEIKDHLQFLQGEKRIVFNKENQEIMILNWLKYNSARSPKVSAVIDKELKEIKTLEFESEVIKKCLEYGYPIKTLKPKENTLSIGYGYGIDTVSQPSSASTPSPEPTPATAQEGAARASSNPFHIYQENFGVLSPLISEDINMWISDMGAELVVEAMRRAIVDQKSYRYAQGILRQWAKKNIDSLEKVKADDIRHESQTKAKGFVSFSIGGNAKGLAILDLDVDDLYDRTFIENPIGFRVIVGSDDWFKMTLKNDKGDELLVEDEWESLGNSMVGIEIVDFIEEDSK